jgi:hypothetical protein
LLMLIEPVQEKGKKGRSKRRAPLCCRCKRFLY